MLSNCDNKMSCGKFEATRKFWEIPELVEKLLPFLDLESTFHLAQAHELTQDILQGSHIWNKLIKRTRLQDGGFFGKNVEGFLGENYSLLEEKIDAVKLLVAILKLMKDPKLNMLDLLDTICKRCPPDVVSRHRDFGAVTIGCPNS